MIKSIIGRNHQSHKDSKLEFSKGVNFIIGDSDSGKSSLFRLFKLIIKNKPGGLEFLSHWCKKNECLEGLLELENDAVIKRRKGTSVNEYQINGEKPLTGFSQDVPEEVAELLNIDDISLQWQFHAPFLLSSTPPEAGRYLNKIVNLDIIDTVFSNIEKFRRRTKGKLDTAKESLKDEQKKLVQFRDLSAMEKEIVNLEKLQGDIEEQEALVRRLEFLVNEIVEKKAELGKYPDLVAIDGEIDKLEDIEEELQNDEMMLAKLEFLVDEISKKKTELSQYPDLVAINKEITELEKVQEKLQNLCSEEDKLTQLVEKILKVKEEVENYDVEIERLNKQFEEEFPDVCPLCGKEK